MSHLTETELFGLVLYAGSAALIGIGLYLVAVRDHVIRILLGLTLLESGVNLVLVAAGFRADAAAPILIEGITANTAMVDPVPQALILTTIVIGVGVLALALAMALQIHRLYGTLSMRALLQHVAREQGEPAHESLPRPTVGSGDAVPPPAAALEGKLT